MKKALVLCYSCSGNTRIIAEHTTAVIKSLNWDVRQLDLNSYDHDRYLFDPDFLVLGVPVHYWDAPQAALKLIRRLPQFNNCAGFVFSTFGRCVSSTVPFSPSQGTPIKRSPGARRCPVCHAAQREIGCEYPPW